VLFIVLFIMLFMRIYPQSIEYQAALSRDTLPNVVIG
jgi:hypothetical protein